MVKLRITPLILFLGMSALVYAACNCETRESDIVAGIHNKSEEHCVALKGEFFGVSIDISERECTLGYAQYDETVYKCGVPSENNNCKSDGYQASFTSYSGGGCLGVPTSKQEALDFLSQGGCKTLNSSSSYDWSASTNSC